MKLLRNTVIRAGLEALYFSGAHYLLRPIFAGVGAIFMLHHVRPSQEGEFQPNYHLEVEPEFLRAMLEHLRSLDVDIVTMAVASLSSSGAHRTLLCRHPEERRLRRVSKDAGLVPIILRGSLALAPQDDGGNSLTPASYRIAASDRCRSGAARRLRPPHWGAGRSSSATP